MTDINELRAILKRLAANTCNNTDFEILCQALETRQITLEQAVFVSGSVTDAVIITGDGNVVYKGPNAEAVYKMVQEILNSFKPSALLTHTKFSEWAISRAEKLAGYSQVPVGRDALLDQIKSLLAESTDVIVLHGAGGIGKTRLLLELPKVIPSRRSLWYVRERAESIEHDLTSLARNNHHVIVVDDAHRCLKLLHQLGEVLVDPELAGKVTLVLATRSVFKDSVSYELGSLSGYNVSEIKVKPLENLDIDQLLQISPYEIADKDSRHTLVRIAKGDPLIAGIAARLVQHGQSVMALNRERVLTDYLNDIIKQLSKAEVEAGYAGRYVGYLEVLAALGTLDLSNQLLRERVQSRNVVDISQPDEDRIIERLVEAGLVERYWMTLKISSEVLADHILIQHFFQTKQADYQKKIIEPFFNLIPKQILTTLAEAEVKGERQAGLLLGQKLRELRHILNQGGNIVRLSILEWVQSFAYLRPDDALLIVTSIVDGQELPPESYQYPLSSKLEIKHERILRKAVDILSYTYWDRPSDSINYLYKLARYKLDMSEYARVRDKADQVLGEIAEFKLGKPQAVQLTLIQKIKVWLEKDFAGNLERSLSLIQLMLRMEFSHTEKDTINYMHIVTRHGILPPSEPLRQLRKQALGILYQAYSQVSKLSEQLKIVKTLNGAMLLPRSISAREVPAETWNWLKLDCQETAQFLLEDVIPNAELPVLDAVAEWLWYAPRFSGYQLNEFEQLKQQLQNNNLYRLYRVLVSNCLRGDSENDQLDWEAIVQRHKQAIEYYIEGLSLATIEQAIWELEAIVEQCKRAGESSTHWFDTLFYKLGEKHPNLAQRLIEKALSENLTLKYHLSHVIGGLYQTDFGVAWSYVKFWIDSDDPTLWLAVTKSFYLLDWSQFQDKEWEILHHLTTKKFSPVDHEILELISRFAAHNIQQVINLLKILANRGDESLILRVAEVLSLSFKSLQDGWGIKFISSEFFLEIVQNFERLSRWNYAAEECLNRLGQIAPMQLINFIERCLISKAEQRGKCDYYEAIHFPYSRAMESIRFSPEYPDALRRVRDWMLREGFWFYEAPNLLVEIVDSLEDPFYNVLMEWIKSDDVKKIGAVANILQKFNNGQFFYSLCREIICSTNDELIWDSIRVSISSTPGAMFIGGGFSNFYRKRLEEISPWLEDENFRVSCFAREMDELLHQYEERERGREKFEERNW